MSSGAEEGDKTTQVSLLPSIGILGEHVTVNFFQVPFERKLSFFQPALSSWNLKRYKILRITNNSSIA
jgi:hypothetical protein